MPQETIDFRENTALSSRSHVDHEETAVREARRDDVDFGMLMAQFRF